MSECNLRFGIKIDKLWKHQFGIGICLYNWGKCKEKYLYLSLIKWTIKIGFIDKDF